MCWIMCFIYFPTFNLVGSPFHQKMGLIKRNVIMELCALGLIFTQFKKNTWESSALKHKKMISWGSF